MILFSLSETPFLYPRAECPLPGTYSFRTRCSEDFIFDSKFEEFPLTRFAQRMEAQLFPGDVLFIPVFTWHQAYYKTPTIGVGNWWLSFQDSFFASPLFALLSIPRYAETYQLHRRASPLFTE